MPMYEVELSRRQYLTLKVEAADSKGAMAQAEDSAFEFPESVTDFPWGVDSVSVIGWWEEDS